MEIKSDNSYSQYHPQYKIVEIIQAIVSFTVAFAMLAMSFGYMTPNLMFVIIGLTINTILYNMVQSLMTLELAQTIENAPMQYILKEKPILGPIGLLTSLTMLGLLLTGNLFGWQIYLAYIVLVTIISKAHKNRLGVVDKVK